MYRYKTNMAVHERGFTLIEMMSAIAIIGILAGIVYASLTNVREQTRINNATSMMNNAQASALACVHRGAALNDRVVGEFVCGTSGLRWPQLPAGWTYLNPTDTISDVSARTYSFDASGDSVTVTCDEHTCTSS